MTSDFTNYASQLQVANILKMTISVQMWLSEYSFIQIPFLNGAKYCRFTHKVLHLDRPQLFYRNLQR